MNQKLKSFLKKIWKKYRRIRYGFGYKTFGEGSIVRKPMRAVGRKHISVGRDVDIMNGLRIEAVTKWGTGGGMNLRLF